MLLNCTEEYYQRIECEQTRRILFHYFIEHRQVRAVAVPASHGLFVSLGSREIRGMGLACKSSACSQDTCERSKAFYSCLISCFRIKRAVVAITRLLDWEMDLATVAVPHFLRGVNGIWILCILRALWEVFEHAIKRLWFTFFQTQFIWTLQH